MPVKIDIFSGFLGAGKTTLIKKLLEEALTGEKIALIENEFGAVGIDGRIMRDYDLQITELNAGCICCSIAGDFTGGLKEVLTRYKPDRILIEPSGVSKLSDVIKGCSPFFKEGTAVLNICLTVIDVTKYKMYVKNFSEFYKDQLTSAGTIIFSRTAKADREKIDAITAEIRKANKLAGIITTDWERLEGKAILMLAEEGSSAIFEREPQKSRAVKGLSSPRISSANAGYIISGHNAEDVFSVWGHETSQIFKKNKLSEMLYRLDRLGMEIVRAKGIVETEDEKWVQFDYVPGEVTINDSDPDYIGRFNVIGSKLDQEKLSRLFNVTN
ncbi:GTP-binding protein [Anaerocolumna sp. AGMB13020]|uniref:GTP-binding protein n=1 Tax=Anaerocolumna sp. AGMB13020 TaxID=3081750 RepID=UPI0029545B5D|nr:GTP-binding protein [Anaerocolumna sp. AGMB13020]WOO35654.1 GTP-binding protein [Anaerocolumna sp. AGMB13020]